MPQPLDSIRSLFWVGASVNELIWLWRREKEEMVRRLVLRMSIQAHTWRCARSPLPQAPRVVPEE